MLVLTKRQKKMKRIAEKLLIKSKHPDYLFCCILVISNRILSTGINRKSRKYHYVPNGKGEIFLHAEMNCLHMIDKKVSNNADLYIYGRTRAGNFIKTKPCDSCMTQIKKSGVKRIFYQEQDGSLTELKL